MPSPHRVFAPESVEHQNRPRSPKSLVADSCPEWLQRQNTGEAGSVLISRSAGSEARKAYCSRMEQNINEITVVDGDDWLGLYVNGKLIIEGHGRSRHADILAFGAEHQPYTVKLLFADVDWLHEEMRLPAKLEDVQIDYSGDPSASLAAQ